MKSRFGVLRMSAAVVAVGILTVLATQAAAAEAKESPTSIEKLDTAINMIPADAAFYSSMQRGREKFEAVANSRAWKKFTEIPLVQMAWQFYEMQTASEDTMPSKVDKTLNDPQVQELLAMLGDMFSDEVFIYGGANVVDTVELFQKLNNVNRLAPLMEQLDDGYDDDNADDEADDNADDDDSSDSDENMAKAKMILAVLAENPEAIKIPDVIIGFKIKDMQSAAAQLGKLDIIAGFTLLQSPGMADAYKRVKIGDDSFSVFTFSGEMIPWNELPLDKLNEYEASPGDVQKIVEQVKKQKMTVAVGLRGDYLLVAIGPSTDALAALGKGESLVDRPEIKRLDQFADKRVTSIGYASERLNRSVADSAEDIDELVKVVDVMLPKSGLDEDVQKQIRQDAAALIEDVKPFMPQPGAVSGVGFISDKGLEEYCYDWGKYPQIDGSKPLGLLRHVGGSPLLAVVGRAKISPENYDLMVKWLRVAYGYAEKFALPQMDKPDREKFDKLAKAVMPLIERSDQINREKLLPAIADGQTGLVIDAKLMSKQIHEAVPAQEMPLPMIEPAVVIGLADVDSFRQAVVEYWQIAEDAAAILSETLPDNPDMKLPEPKTQQIDDGEIYSLALPKEAGLDEQIGLYLAFNKSVAVFCLNEEQAKRLLADAKLSVGGVLADENRPRAKAVAFNMPETLKAVMPWAEIGVKKTASRFMGDEDMKKVFGVLNPQFATLAEVLSAVRGITCESYFEDGIMVTHSLMEISDIK